MLQPPTVIQGGMGVGVSGWRLARAVGRLGHLGVVSGTGIDVVHARRLGDGDPGGHLRRAYAHFPVPALAERVLERWLVPGGRGPGERYRKVPMDSIDAPDELCELTILANFAEVWLAREGHDGPVGINYLEKVQLPLVRGFYGAMLAGVDVVLMGAGIPSQVPGVLTDLALGRPAAYRLSVAGADPGDDHAVRLDPSAVWGSPAPELPRPRFAAIISSNTLASFLLKDAATTPDWFVVEGATAGGHNAPPRGRLQLDPEGQPVYGPRDRVDLDKMAATGIPFWLAGGYGDPGQLQAARRAGAAGVQVGTAFALCDESDLRDDLKSDIIRSVLDGGLEVRTDPLASPSGFPFKVAQVPGTIADEAVYAERRRVCDLGYLRTPYKKPDGTLGYRCPSEPVDTYVAKGGKREDTVGRKCLCNALFATVDLAQERSTGPEAPIVTAGDDLERVVRSLATGGRRWTAADVIGHLLGHGLRAESAVPPPVADPPGCTRDVPKHRVTDPGPHGRNHVHTPRWRAPVPFAVIFPGQGSATPGAGRAWVDHPAWSVVDEAEEVLDRPLARLLLDADADELATTEASQLAVLLGSLVAWEALQATLAGPPVAFAGHSLGQITALLAAGAVDRADGLRLAAERAALSQASADARPGRMAALVGADVEVAARACDGAGEVWVANDNAPGQVVIAGTPEGLAAAGERARVLGVRRVLPLDVGHAFHTPLLADAAAGLRPLLDRTSFRPTEVPVIANTDALGHTDPGCWPDQLVRHLVEPVRWRESQRALVAAGAEQLVEVGPGRVLAGLAKRAVPQVEVRGVTSPDDLAHDHDPAGAPTSPGDAAPDQAVAAR